MQILEIANWFLSLLSEPLIPFAIFAFLGMISPAVNRLGKRLLKREITSYWLLTNLTTLLLILPFRWPPPSGTYLFSNVLSWDPFALFFVILFIAIGYWVTISSIKYLKDNPNQEAYYSLLPLALLGMMLVSLAADLIILFAAWELIGISTYTLVSIRKDSPMGTEAALKYLVVGVASSAVIIFGISLIFGITGSTQLSAIVNALPTISPIFHLSLIIGVILLTAGFGFKIGIVPFHMWMPDTYEGAPQTVTALLSGGSNKAGFAAAVRVLIPLMLFFQFIPRLNLSLSIAFLSLITMTLGNVAALMQKSVSRMLVYSGIAQAGYTLIGLAVLSPLGLQGLLFHVLNDGIAKTGAFVATASVGFALSNTDVESFCGLSRRLPVTAFTLSVILLALAGVPPLNGFFSKLVLFTAAVDGNLLWLAIAGILNSAFSLSYYGWVIKRMYFDEPIIQINSQNTSESFHFVFVLVTVAVAIIAIGIFSGPILNFFESIVLQL